ncbi:MAG: hypothetical protein R3Y22_01670 [Bacteroidales bacterium]
MNNIFELKRFGKVLKSDISFYWLQERMRFLSVLATILVVGWLMSKASVEDRAIFFLVVALTYSLFTLFKVYGGVNNKKGGADYLMLPASSLEKFISMVILAVICSPILLILAMLAVDTLLVTISNDFYSNQYMSFADIFNQATLKIWVSYLVTSTIFIYCNLLFKKSKVAKTILSIVLASMIIGSIGSSIAYSAIRSEFDKMQVVDNSDNQNGLIQFDNKTYYVDGEENNFYEAKYGWITDFIWVLFYGVLPVTMLTLSYYRIRRMQI